MIAKIHKSEENIILALCDSSILGQVFEENELILDLNSNFYKGEKIEKNKIKQIILKVSSVNAVGKEVVDFLIKEKFILEENVRKVAGVPYAYSVIVKD